MIPEYLKTLHIFILCLFSLLDEIQERCIIQVHMSEYNRPPSITFSSFTISQEVAARKAARKKVIERARKLERDSYIAKMRRKRQLQAASALDTMV
jgi:hypothetical protein